MKRNFFGTTRSGEAVEQLALSDGGLTVTCISYGCRITGIFPPGCGNIALSLPTLEEYERDGTYMGAVVGRYANRIKGAAFRLNGKDYRLTRNDGGNYLHGCFHEKVFAIDELDDRSVTFSRLSEDGEDGFPGRLKVRVKYSVADGSRLIIEHFAESDKDTFVSMTNHTYFNLSGEGSISDHSLFLNSGSFLEAGEDLCPTGKILETDGEWRAFAFSSPKMIGTDIGRENPQLRRGNGYDHCYVLNGRAHSHWRPSHDNDGTRLAAEAHAPNGVGLAVFTTQPTLHFYSGNFLASAGAGKSYADRSGFALETQRYPDSPNRPEFPSALLRAGEIYHDTTVLEISRPRPRQPKNRVVS